jgi:hypothetical protein
MKGEEDMDRQGAGEDAGRRSRSAKDTARSKGKSAAAIHEASERLKAAPADQGTAARDAKLNEPSHPVGEARCGAVRADPAGLGGELPGLRGAQALAAVETGGH